MALNRRLAPLPASFDFDQVVALTKARYRSALTVNTVEADDGSVSLAAYWDGWAPAQSSLDAWRAEVAGHVPAHPTAEERATIEAANFDDLRQKLLAAVAGNNAAIAEAQAFLATAKPATAAAQASSAYDQAKALTQGTISTRRQLNALIRIALGLLDTTAGT